MVGQYWKPPTGGKAAAFAGWLASDCLQASDRLPAKMAALRAGDFRDFEHFPLFQQKKEHMFCTILHQKVSNKRDFLMFFWPFFAVFNGERGRFSIPAFFPSRALPIFARVTRTRNGDRSVIDLLLPAASGDTRNPPPKRGKGSLHLQPFGRLTYGRARSSRRAAEPPRGWPAGVRFSVLPDNL